LAQQEPYQPLHFLGIKQKKNPIVLLPKSCNEILKKVTHCLTTHKHPDHLDLEGEKFLRKHKIPITCSVKDEDLFKKKGLNIVQPIDYWKKTDFLGGTIEGIPAKHGYGFVAKPMGDVMGFYIELPNQKSIYLSSDTIYTNAVDKVLKEYKPNISVVACGTAQLDIFKPLLMTMEDILKFIKNSPGEVIANHLEAVNHCPTTRVELHNELVKNELSKKVSILIDGEIISFN